MSIGDQIGAWGNLNAIVYLERPKSQFYTFAETLAGQFSAREVVFDSFDLEKNIAGFGRPNVWGDRLMVRAILEGNNELIIVEQLDDVCFVEHLFRPWFLKEEVGSAILQSIINDNTILGWVLGFELSIDLEPVSRSFDVVWQDPSQYPIIVFEPGKNPSRKEHGVYEPMLSILRDYEVKLNSPLPT